MRETSQDSYRYNVISLLICLSASVSSIRNGISYSNFLTLFLLLNFYRHPSTHACEKIMRFCCNWFCQVNMRIHWNVNKFDGKYACKITNDSFIIFSSSKWWFHAFTFTFFHWLTAKFNIGWLCKYSWSNSIIFFRMIFFN